MFLLFIVFHVYLFFIFILFFIIILFSLLLDLRSSSNSSPIYVTTRPISTFFLQAQFELQTSTAMLPTNRNLGLLFAVRPSSSRMAYTSLVFPCMQAIGKAHVQFAPHLHEVIVTSPYLSATAQTSPASPPCHVKSAYHRLTTSLEPHHTLHPLAQRPSPI